MGGLGKRGKRGEARGPEGGSRSRGGERVRVGIDKVLERTLQREGRLARLGVTATAVSLRDLGPTSMSHVAVGAHRWLGVSMDDCMLFPLSNSFLS